MACARFARKTLIHRSYGAHATPALSAFAGLALKGRQGES